MKVPELRCVNGRVWGWVKVVGFNFKEGLHFFLFLLFCCSRRYNNFSGDNFKMCENLLVPIHTSKGLLSSITPVFKELTNVLCLPSEALLEKVRKEYRPPKPPTLLQSLMKRTHMTDSEARYNVWELVEVGRASLN